MDKEIEVKSVIKAIPASLLEATTALAENLAQSEPFMRFQESDRKLQADGEAMQILTEFMELRQKINAQRNSGTIPESDFNRLRELQAIISTSEVIQEQSMAQRAAMDFLRDVNMEISNLLGVDFASLTRRSSGCC